ncbi:MAG TPA: hypothetical protein VEB64_00655 [Azospirillaceae bacterium]|nr:hypothetical protein [Azospirillaceae bacterium]
MNLWISRQTSTGLGGLHRWGAARRLRRLRLSGLLALTFRTGGLLR